MRHDLYTRFGVMRPEHVGEAHWDAINIEIVRFARALEAGDDPQAIGYLKCLVEAVAKVVLDINGTPASGNENFDTIVSRAHELLATQPGRELAYQTPFRNLATQARKMAVSMGTIRNNFGAGHGRARQPEMRSEILDLAIDGSLLWVRWALRRLGYFAQGRPETLIRDLVGDPHGSIIFYSGDLTERLSNANLPNLEPKHARAIGVAVGQRAAMNTFNVRIEGVDACVADPDLTAGGVPDRRSDRALVQPRGIAYLYGSQPAPGYGGLCARHRRIRRDHLANPACNGDPTARSASWRGRR